MITKLFKDPTSKISIQAFRYILSGSLAYTVDFSLLIILTEIFDFHYLASAAIAFFFGSVTSYMLNVSWVFDKRTFKNRHIEIMIFAVIGVVGLCLNHYCIWFFTESVRLHYVASKVISTIIVFVMNFFSRKYILFR